MASARGQKYEMTMTSIEVLYELAAMHPKKVAFIKDKEIWTYDRLAAEVDQLAYGLVQRVPSERRSRRSAYGEPT
jgi:non-ribosomal peptide synthetase component E (peptide arylation enzyme)